MEKNKMLRKDALTLLKKEGCSEEIIGHSIIVSENALKIAQRINGEIDENIVEIGGLLHDIGRGKTNSVFHGIEGAKILKRYNIDPAFVEICKNHLGSGIEKDEAEKLGLPKKDYLPKTKEERLIAYVDNLVIDGRFVSFDQALEHFKKKIKNERSIKRFLEMNEEFGGYL
ncbi:MAG: HD domain-containing protein [Methanomicrobia archaeon]|nr:HD domain-containing protein [Methanomicrobia archaeon]